ncbi:MAG: phosphotransferase, partial [Akkermansiaceae bacterium]|nr:phosphotransferase [Armatimonadota bacterium]
MMERYQVILCALQNGHRSILLVPGEGASADRWQLPEFCPVTEAYNTDIAVANDALQKQFGLPGIRTRYAVRLPNAGYPLNLYVLEPLRERVATYSIGSRWFAVDELAALHFSTPIQGELLLAWLRDVGGDGQTTLLPWWHEGWIAQAKARFHRLLNDGQRTSTLPIEQLRSAYTAAVLRADTGTGSVYLKTVSPPFRHEARLTKLLSERHPDQLPSVLSAGANENRHDNSSELLTADVGGESVGSHTALSTWTEIVHRYASLQSESTGRIGLLLENGCVDLRVATVRGRVSKFSGRLQSALRGSPAGLTDDEWNRLDTLSPRFDTALRQLDALGLPDCLEHGDLHVGNLRWNPAKKSPVFLDWSHACVTFPFYGYGTLILDDDWFGPDAQVATARVEWAYLSPWAAYAGPQQMAEAFVLWKPLRHLFIAERQIEIITSFQELWTNANRDAASP